jgi:hypothetical protein
MKLLTLALALSLCETIPLEAKHMDAAKMQIEFSKRVPEAEIAEYRDYISKVRDFYKISKIDAEPFEYMVFDQGEVIVVSSINKNKPRGVRGYSSEFNEFNFFIDSGTKEIIQKIVPR